MRFFLISLLLWWCAAGLAAPVRTGHVEAELVAEDAAVVPGQRLTVALRLKMEPHWHTYWRNPGDSGLPTTIAWRLPPGFTAGEIQWPAPQRLATGPLMNYGYDNEVLLLTDISVPRGLPASSAALTLRARADWLVCKDICIPESAELALALPVLAAGTPGSSAWSARIAATRAALPTPLKDWQASAHRLPGGRIELALAAQKPGAFATLAFFPYEQGKVEPAGQQPLLQYERGARLALPPAQQPVGEFTHARGVLAGATSDGRAFAASVDTAISAQSPPEFGALRSGAGASASISLIAALALAFMGGLILNLMPCVFPVLSIKIFEVVRGAHRKSRDRFAHAAYFTAGLLTSFLALAGVLIALRALGAELGWGFQLQSPPTIVALALLFFTLAMNMSGVFEFTLGPALAAGAEPRHRHLKAYLGGVLAAVVASPCTAPFMGAALGYAATRPAPDALAVFAALALGMSVPFSLLCCFPALLSRLPKPGAWMERLKQLLAFPLYATVVWLAWVLGSQAGIDAMTWLASALLAAAFAAWAYGNWQRGMRWGRVAAAVAMAAAVMLAWPANYAVRDNGSQPAAAGDAWQPYSRARLAELIAAGKPVFVDFTAAWCVTCQVNKRLVLERARVMSAFAERGVVLLRADWTLRDAEISAALAEIGRNGVPVYVLHLPGKPPLLLPELLTESIMLDAIRTVEPIKETQS